MFLPFWGNTLELPVLVFAKCFQGRIRAFFVTLAAFIGALGDVIKLLTLVYTRVSEAVFLRV